MSKADYKIEGTVPRELLVSEVRKAARQFAMQFFHFSKVLYDQFGLEKTKDIVRQTVFELAVDRSDQLREKALAQGLKADSVEDFMSVIDLPFTGWIPEWGEDHLSIQLLCHLCIRKCQRRSDDSCQLCVMSTAVSCLCLLICMCMLRNPQGIQFSDQCQGCISGLFFI